jgi:hypothetical protein
VNDIDWTHVVEEIEDVGLSELNAVHSHLRQILVHLPKLHGWPTLGACPLSRSEVMAFQTDAQWRFTPAMRQRIDLDTIYARAVLQIGMPPRSAYNSRMPDDLYDRDILAWSERAAAVWRHARGRCAQNLPGHP